MSLRLLEKPGCTDHNYYHIGSKQEFFLLTIFSSQNGNLQKREARFFPTRAPLLSSVAMLSISKHIMIEKSDIS